MNLAYYKNLAMQEQQINKLQIENVKLNDQVNQNQFLLSRYIHCKEIGLPNYADILFYGYTYSDLCILEARTLLHSKISLVLNISHSEENNIELIKDKFKSIFPKADVIQSPLEKIKKDKTLIKFKNLAIIVVSEDILKSIKASIILSKKEFTCVVNCSELLSKW